MRLTFLGTGTSTGVPEIGCTCPVCTSKDPRDKRFRSSVLVEAEGAKILIDCGPDFRCQALRYHISALDAVLLTHEHYDHVGGLDDLRPFSRSGLNIYTEANVADAIRTRLPYVFRKDRYPGVPDLHIHEITLEPFYVAGVEVIPIRLMHASLPIMGFRIGGMAYLTDVKMIPEEEFAKLADLDLLVIDALRREPHLSHICVDEALDYVARINPRRTYFTHMSHRIGLHESAGIGLPSTVKFTFDGAVIECSQLTICGGGANLFQK